MTVTECTELIRLELDAAEREFESASGRVACLAIDLDEARREMRQAGERLETALRAYEAGRV